MTLGYNKQILTTIFLSWVFKFMKQGLSLLVLNWWPGLYFLHEQMLPILIWVKHEIFTAIEFCSQKRRNFQWPKKLNRKTKNLEEEQGNNWPPWLTKSSNFVGHWTRRGPTLQLIRNCTLLHQRRLNHHRRHHSHHHDHHRCHVCELLGGPTTTAANSWSLDIIIVTISHHHHHHQHTGCFS